MKMEEQFNKKFDMDYDGMGNQGRFPVTKKIENMKEDVISGALKAIIIILLSCIVVVLFTGCEKELFIDHPEILNDSEESTQSSVPASQTLIFFVSPDGKLAPSEPFRRGISALILLPLKEFDG